MHGSEATDAGTRNCRLFWGRMYIKLKNLSALIKTCVYVDAFVQIVFSLVVSD